MNIRYKPAEEMTVNVHTNNLQVMAFSKIWLIIMNSLLDLSYDLTEGIPREDKWFRFHPCSHECDGDESNWSKTQ